MTLREIIQLILLIEQGVKPLLELIAQLKAQSGMTTDQLLDAATSIDQATRDRVKKFLDSL